MHHWWYEKEGMATGPVSNEELRQLILSGDVEPNVLVWCTGYGNWWEYDSLIAEFGDDVLEWSLENMTEIKDAEDDLSSLRPPPLPIQSTTSTKTSKKPENLATPFIEIPDKVSTIKDFVGKNTYKKTTIDNIKASSMVTKNNHTPYDDGTPMEYNNFEKAFIKSQKQKKEQKSKSALSNLIKLSFVIAISYAAGLIGGIVIAIVSMLSCIVIIYMAECYIDNTKDIGSNSENISNNNKRSAAKIFIIVLAIFAGVIGKDFVKVLNKPIDNEIKSLKHIAETLPIMVDNETRWDKLLLSDNIATFEYALVNYKSNEIDRSGFLATIRPAITPDFCLNMRKSIQSGMSVKIKYYSSDNELVAMFIITKSDCNSINNPGEHGLITAPPRPKDKL